MSYPHKYKLILEAEANDLQVELYCFRTKRPITAGGVGTFNHYRRAENLIWGKKLDWHDWTEARIKGLVHNTVNVWSGAAASGKTHDAARYAMVWWLADPLNSSVMLTSTTGKSIRRRIWPVIQKLFTEAVAQFPGNLVDSKTTLQAKKGDDKHGIFAIAVREGPVTKAVADIQGIHSKRMLLIIDEATDTPEAIFEAIPNLLKGCNDFQIIVIGNAASKIDPHGRCAEPALGWESISIEDDEWPTKGVAEWQIDPGICLHFDGTKSPNIKSGTTKWPYLYSQADLNRRLAHPEATQTIGYWKYDRGWWVPEGFANTVFTEPLFFKHDGFGKFIFRSQAIPVGGIDPSFTSDGDGCVMRFGLLGDAQSGKRVLQLTDSYKVPIKTGEDVTYQIARSCIEQCGKRGIQPKAFGIDVGSNGRGVADILVREWGPGIVRVEFGAMASDMPVSNEDPRKCRDAYANKVTELWYSVRELLLYDLVKGFSRDELKQFCTREYEDKKRRLELKPKDKCRAELGFSPDEADACSVVCDVARRLGLSLRRDTPSRGTGNWKELAMRADSVYANIGQAESEYAHTER